MLQNSSLGRKFDLLMVALVIISVVVMILETMPELASLRRAAPDLLPIAAPHVSLEFTALLLGASAGWVLLGDCINCLAHNRPVRIRGVAAAVAAAFLLLLVAAWFEVRLIDGDFSPWDIFSR